MKNIFITGGGGYVGSVLVPKLLEENYHVKVLDLFIYGEEVLSSCAGHPNLTVIKGDIRDRGLLEREIKEIDAVIHLACISNDPSFELNPELGKSINYDAFIDLVEVSKAANVKRFIYASSSSVYGIREENNVTEELELKPLTDYSKYKALCEEVLLAAKSDDFCVLIARPATVCGYSPRLRLDLTVNILTNHAVTNNMIKVFGGEQRRPNIHIKDMVNFYLQSLRWSDDKINGEIFNVGYENHPVKDIANIVREVVGEKVEITTTPSDDLRSYHISSEKIKKSLDFSAEHTIEDAVKDLLHAFKEGTIPHSMTDDFYYNIKRMQNVKLR